MTMAVSIGDDSAVQAIFYVGKPGQTPILNIPAALTDGAGSFVFDTEDTKIPLGTYNYQINIEYSDGIIEKYPAPEDCPEDELPEFIVYEALDLQEVS